jgi:hypothetical protein
MTKFLRRTRVLLRFLSSSGLRRRGKTGTPLYPSQDFSERCESDRVFCAPQTFLRSEGAAFRKQCRAKADSCWFFPRS